MEEPQYTDFLGEKLEIGDKVIYMDNHYKQFKNGEISKLNKCKATINKYITYKGAIDEKDKAFKEYCTIIKVDGLKF